MDERELQREETVRSVGRSSRASTVAAGILSSRVLGLARQATVSYFFGVSAHTDVYEAAFRAPNILQNLLGEGTISAAFIPTYTRLLNAGRVRDAGRFAGAIFGLLSAVTAVLVVVGMLLARPVVALFTPGFVGDAARVSAGTLSVDRFELAVEATRLIFPMTGVLVLSAWALGVLNSHRRFFLPYFAPVLWNFSIIGGLFSGVALLTGDGPVGAGVWSIAALNRLLFAAFLGALVGGVLQFLIQLPLVWRLMEGFRVSCSTKVEGVRQALAACGPAIAGRGVYQLSAYLDLLLASFLAAGALAALRPALMLYLLPVSLFGQSVAASELPELSREAHVDSRSLIPRLDRSMGQTLFLTVPAAVGYLGLGFLIVDGLLRRGAFGLLDTWLVYGVLAGYSLGLVATTLSRLLQNGFWALRDTVTPARVAVARVVVSAAIAVPLMFALDRWLVAELVGAVPDREPLYCGAVGLALGATVGAWVELWRLATALRRQFSTFRIPWRRMLLMTGLSVGALAPAAVIGWWLRHFPSLPVAGAVVGTYAAVYLGCSRMLGFAELDLWMGRVRR